MTQINADVDLKKNFVRNFVEGVGKVRKVLDKITRLTGCSGWEKL